MKKLVFVAAVAFALAGCVGVPHTCPEPQGCAQKGKLGHTSVAKSAASALGKASSPGKGATPGKGHGHGHGHGKGKGKGKGKGHGHGHKGGHHGKGHK